jgi:hypothetical protein
MRCGIKSLEVRWGRRFSSPYVFDDMLEPVAVVVLEKKSSRIMM